MRNVVLFWTIAVASICGARTYWGVEHGYCEIATSVSRGDGCCSRHGLEIPICRSIWGEDRQEHERSSH